MSQNNTTTHTTTRGGITFTGLLTIAFVVLKLTGVIDWSWWWVLSPLWIGALCTLILAVVLGVVFWWGGRP